MRKNSMDLHTSKFPKIILGANDLPVFLKKDISYGTVKQMLGAIRGSVVSIADLHLTNSQILSVLQNANFTFQSTNPSADKLADTDIELFMSSADYVKLREYIEKVYTYVSSIVTGIKKGGIRITGGTPDTVTRLMSAISMFNDAILTYKIIVGLH